MNAPASADTEFLTLKVEDGALVEAPVYESHKRGRNWLAVIRPDPRAPSGLGRVFQEAAKGRYFYLVHGLRPGQAVEFGADYYSASGRKDTKRWYGNVVVVLAESVVLQKATAPVQFSGQYGTGTSHKLALQRWIVSNQESLDAEPGGRRYEITLLLESFPDDVDERHWIVSLAKAFGAKEVAIRKFEADGSFVDGAAFNVRDPESDR